MNRSSNLKENFHQLATIQKILFFFYVRITVASKQHLKNWTIEKFVRCNFKQFSDPFANAHLVHTYILTPATCGVEMHTDTAFRIHLQTWPDTPTLQLLHHSIQPLNIETPSALLILQRGDFPQAFDKRCLNENDINNINVG